MYPELPMTARVTLSTAALLLLVAVVASDRTAVAHHAFAAEFDDKSPVLLRGRVTKVEWINPHAWLHMVIEEPGKSPTAWMVEAGTPNTLIRGGLTRDALKTGTQIIVRGYQAKDKRCAPACKANGRDITFNDGTKVFMGSSGTGAPRDGADNSEK
jgi:hypothetical protein